MPTMNDCKLKLKLTAIIHTINEYIRDPNLHHHHETSIIISTLSPFWQKDPLTPIPDLVFRYKDGTWLCEHTKPVGGVGDTITTAIVIYK